MTAPSSPPWLPDSPWAPPEQDVPSSEDWALGLGIMIPTGVCFVLCSGVCIFICNAFLPEAFGSSYSNGGPDPGMMLVIMGLPTTLLVVVFLSLAVAAVVLGAQGRGPEAMLIFGIVMLASPLLLLVYPALGVMHSFAVAGLCDCGGWFRWCCHSFWCFPCNRRTQAVARRAALTREREQEARELEQARATRAAEEGALSLDCDSCGTILMRFGRARWSGSVFVNGPTVFCCNCYTSIDEERAGNSAFRRTTVAAAAGLRAGAATLPLPAPPLEWTLQAQTPTLCPLSPRASPLRPHRSPCIPGPPSLQSLLCGPFPAAPFHCSRCCLLHRSVGCRCSLRTTSSAPSRSPSWRSRSR